MESTPSNSKTFTVSCSDSVKLSCHLSIPAAQPAAEGVVLLVHGRLHTKHRGPLSLSTFAQHFPFATIAVDARGMGESEGQTGYDNVEQEVQDLTCVMEHIKSLEAPYNRLLGIIGHSKGAVVSLLAACTPTFATLNPRPLVINLSGRFDASNLSQNRNRFTPEQYEELDTKGSFVWLNYRAGPEPERPERRPYVVTKVEMDRHATRTLAPLEHNLPAGLSVLTLHGRTDGTVPFDNSVKMDQTIARSEATSDLMLLEGVGHNWDRPGNAQLLLALVSGWMTSRLATPLVKQKEVPLVDHLGTQRKKLDG